MNTLEMTMPVGYLFCWRPMDGGPDLSTAQKVRDYFGFGEWKACYGGNLFGFNKGLSKGICKGACQDAWITESNHGITIPVTSNVVLDSAPILLRVQNLGFDGIKDNYTFSADISATNNINLNINICDKASITVAITSAKQRVVTCDYIDQWHTIGAYNGFLDFECIDNIPAGTTISIDNIKIERGTEPTDWTPAPEDISASLSFLPTDYKCYRRIA